MLNIAYLGNGKSTNRYHLPFMLKSGKFILKTIFARHLDGPWEKLPQVHYTQDLNDLYHDDTLDLIVITTPPEFHFQYAKECLEHGKNVLVEKPFARTKTEAEELFRLAKERGLFIQTYQNRRFDSDFLTTQKVIESGKLGTLLEVEDNYDYYRPEVPASSTGLDWTSSFLYTHACHTVDQVISYWGQPQQINYDVRQLLGTNKMNDYFDLDFNYQNLKVSIRSSYFRIKARPTFVAYGTKGMFVKETEDRQEIDLKHFYLPTNDHPDFGLDQPEHYGTLTYYDDQSNYHEEKVVSEVGDYARMYEAVYESIANHQPKVVQDWETIAQIEILEQAFGKLQ